VRQLADWGAKVIKIEPPGSAHGDVVGGHRHGFDFQNLHRNKRAMTLNLKTTEGHEIFFKLAEKADVVVENYRSDVKHRLGIDLMRRWQRSIRASCMGAYRALVKQVPTPPVPVSIRSHKVLAG
jgi:crotonobetainyl-CoA:carnitine CoA-transferase CaiB-like acyl-CoA transferase